MADTPGRRKSVRIQNSSKPNYCDGRRDKQNEIDSSEDECTIGFNASFDRALEGIEADVKRPTELMSKNDIPGSRMYNICSTRGKRGGMLQKARTYGTPGSSKPSPIVVTKNVKVCIEKAEIPNNSTVQKSWNKRKVIRNPSESESVSEDSEYQLDSDDDEDSSSDEGDNEENEVDRSSSTSDEASAAPEAKKVVAEKLLPSKKTETVNTCVSLRVTRGTTAHQDYHMKSDEYFTSQTDKSVTSNRTLGMLKNRHIEEGKLQELLANKDYISKEHKECIRKLSEKCEEHFPMWIFLMEQGFSICLHGLGSKRLLINKFHETKIFEHPTLVINGFFPSLTTKDILDGIVVDILNKKSIPNQNECLELIEKTMKINPDDRLYLLVHNIDGEMLRSKKAQDVLSRLASIQNIHLLASVDHVNAPLIWDNVKRSRYNFYWQDATTFLPYDEETSYEGSLLVQRSGALALSSLRNVFKSLTSNGRSIYILLVKYQLENGRGHNYSGMAFKDLYRFAREAFLVSTELALRSQLTEFIDHKLVRSRRNVDGIEYLVIPLDNALLNQFLEQQNEL